MGPFSFGVTPQILLVLIVALILWGGNPSKIVQIGKKIGKFAHDIRKASSEVTGNVVRELDEETKNNDSSKSAMAKGEPLKPEKKD